MMFKLSMIMCSAVFGTCYPEVLVVGHFEDYYQCAVAGYQQSITALDTLGQQEVINKQIFIKFMCVEYELI